jgi:hypothetical protein
MAYRIILRRDTAANWTSNNPVLLAGEPGYETDTGKMKMGDGESTWNNLDYFVINPTGVTGAAGATGATGPSINLLNVASHIIPATGGVYDLGATAGYEWRDLYLSGNSIYLGGAKLSSDGTNVNINSLIIGGPTGDGGVLLSATGGVIFSDGIPVGSGIIDTEYADLLFGATSGTLIPGSFYKITDFRTCYDQPDFNYSGIGITGGIYKQASIEPIIVFATSESTISIDAYQPDYPNDSIKYDLTWSQTEVTGGTAYGRISERIDEYNNRTDYDHRTILFKRYRLYTHREDQPLNGTIEIFPGGSVGGTGTTFTELSPGDVIYVPNVSPNYYEITTIADDFNMGVTGDNLDTGGPGLRFYKAIEETNDGDGGYFSYKRTNVKTNDFIEYTTFGDAIDQNFAKNNYVGNFANIRTNIDPPYTFLLANNVFIQGQYESNKFGDYCYNNTWGTDNGNNTWGDYCYNNVSTNDIDENIIGHHFRDNLINTNLTDNHIGNDFNNNQLLAENEEDFEDNIIGNGFNGNIIYSRFYKNEILDNFNDNVIGDSGSLTNFEFYRNYIRNNFNQNSIRQDFQNNQIGSNFQENAINGEFMGNTILNGFNTNKIFGDFDLNNIGNGFNNNTIYDNFSNNNTDYYFNNNIISYNFNDNTIGTYFENNNPYNYNSFGWESLSTVSTRTYDTLRVSLNNNVGSNILYKELVMRIISTSQYFKIRFTKWTQGGNGGGFQYERQEIDSNGNEIDDFVIFTKTDYGSEVDVIVEGVVELTRDDQGGLYNTITDTPPFNNQWPGPGDTEWNSIYTEPNNGKDFRNNKIGNYFGSNVIGNDFAHNQIGNNFYNNNINEGFGYGYNTSQGNVIGNYFYENTIGEYFYNNKIVDGFYNNEVYDYFQMNDIKTQVYGTDFTSYYGNITTFTYSSTGSTATDGSYIGLTGSTNGAGVNSLFNVGVSGGNVSSVNLNQAGKYYNINDTITILGSQIGGTDVDDDVVITVTAITPKPTVYEAFNCDIFKNSANDNRLSFYDGDDILTIKNIND